MVLSNPLWTHFNWLLVSVDMSCPQISSDRSATAVDVALDVHKRMAGSAAIS